MAWNGGGGGMRRGREGRQRDKHSTQAARRVRIITGHIKLQWLLTEKTITNVLHAGGCGECWQGCCQSLTVSCCQTSFLCSSYSSRSWDWGWRCFCCCWCCRVLWSPNDRCRIVSFIKIQTASDRGCPTARKMLLSKGLNCQPYPNTQSPVPAPAPAPVAASCSCSPPARGSHLAGQPVEPLRCFIVGHWRG